MLAPRPLGGDLTDDLGRADDDPEVVKRRLEVYMEKTTPLMDYYRQRGMLLTVDAMDEPETVFGRILEAIGRMKATPAPAAGNN